MQLAASPLFLPHAAPSEVITALWPFQSHLHAAGIKLGSASPNVIFPKLQPGAFQRPLSIQVFTFLQKVTVAF